MKLNYNMLNPESINTALSELEITANQAWLMGDIPVFMEISRAADSVKRDLEESQKLIAGKGGIYGFTPKEVYH